jgi:transposase-like protein
MSRGKPIDPNVKAEIVTKIRDGGLSVVDASATYDISSKTIYAWLREGVVDCNRNLILENNKLKKELEIAYRIIGRFAAESQRPKG